MIPETQSLLRTEKENGLWSLEDSDTIKLLFSGLIRAT